MTRQLCIHGHFYQPPREDPWLGCILNEASAAPIRLWNERILRESYAPLAYARRQDDQGRITDIINCYEWISFNFGPTLMQWLDRRAPHIVRRITGADKASLARWGHGNAIAQIYHHIIMPLASEQDKELEVAWSVADFKKRYGRQPEGMWLSECAVDTASLETLANHGIKFTILAPRQAKSIAPITPANGQSGDWQRIDESQFDIRYPYLVELPSGRSISVFFYNAPISQAVAFERLLRDGESFWHRLSGASGEGLLTVGTDGETYGHHFTFGEMALAYVLAQAYSGREGMSLTNYARFLADNPPRFKVLLHESSSWSCVHGVERWRSNCGCTDGGHANWNQEWRGPLRECVEIVKSKVDEFFFERGKTVFKDPQAALVDYGCVLADPSEERAFVARHFKDQDSQDQGWHLLSMQEQSLASLASCAWFFDDISRLEPLNSMTFALRASELLKNLGGPDLLPLMKDALAKARSNKPEEGSGADIFERTVMPRRESPASLCLQGLSALWLSGHWVSGMPGETARRMSWPSASVELLEFGEDLAKRTIVGKAVLRYFNEQHGQEIEFDWLPPFPMTLACPEFCCELLNTTLLRQSRIAVRSSNGEISESKFTDLPLHKRQGLVMIMLTSLGKSNMEKLMPFAMHAISVLEPWEEAQHEQPLAELWSEFLPYLGLACVTAEGVSDEQRKEAARYINMQHITEQQHRRMLDIIESAVLGALGMDMGSILNFSKDTETLEETIEVYPSDPNIQLAKTYVDRANAMDLSINWWRVQNRVWDLGVSKPELRELASCLWFRV